MASKMGRIVKVGMLGLLAQTVAHGDQQFACTDGVETRLITVVYEVQGQTVPCRVDYDKAGNVKTLWSAKNTVGYCEEKANIFLEQQRNWGFSCEHNEVKASDASSASDVSSKSKANADQSMAQPTSAQPAQAQAEPQAELQSEPTQDAASAEPVTTP